MASDKNLVIIPTYNERENIEDIIIKIMSFEIMDILVIDDSSPDGTADIVKGIQPEFEGRLHLIERKGKLGLGTAYIAGFKWALEYNYDYIFEMDADFSHNPKDLHRLLKAVHNGADMSIGSRYISGVNVVNWPIQRVLMSYFASKYVKFITGMPIHDATSGFKCYARRVIMSIPLDEISMVGYGFQIEMKYRAWKKGFYIKEIPIIFTDRKKGVSKMSSGIFGEAFWGVLKMCLNKF